MPYHGPNGVRWLMEQLAERGWQVHREDDFPISLSRNGASVSLEPGAQFELSGAPFDALESVAAEARDFGHDLDVLTADLPVHQVALGFTPFANIHDLGWVPKGRYRIMRKYLAQTGYLAHHMMKGSCAIQASYDYASQDDCATKVQLATAVAPLTMAMFANSPLCLGKPSGWMSYRGQIWRNTDNDRSGFPDCIRQFSYERWVDYLLDVPMMFYFLNGQWTEAKGRTFRNWLENGHNSLFPTTSDWELHVTSVFPEVRIKGSIEVRGADCVGLSLAMAFVALFKGLFYCPTATSEAIELANELEHYGTLSERFDIASRLGLAGQVGNRRLSDWAERLVGCADRSLDRCAKGDHKWLKPLIKQISTGESPGVSLLEGYQAAPKPETIFELAHVLK
ncbi:MAG: hypothetical protein HN348_10785 [Proteobacteria bacterium]|nr:hypothetical protein [Pseudomonadota bacterium]